MKNAGRYFATVIVGLGILFLLIEMVFLGKEDQEKTRNLPEPRILHPEEAELLTEWKRTKTQIEEFLKESEDKIDFPMQWHIGTDTFEKWRTSFYRMNQEVESSEELDSLLKKSFDSGERVGEWKTKAANAKRRNSAR